MKTNVNVTTKKISSIVIHVLEAYLQPTESEQIQRWRPNLQVSLVDEATTASKLETGHLVLTPLRNCCSTADPHDTEVYTGDKGKGRLECLSHSRGCKTCVVGRSDRRVYSTRPSRNE